MVPYAALHFTAYERYRSALVTAWGYDAPEPPPASGSHVSCFATRALAGTHMRGSGQQIAGRVCTGNLQRPTWMLETLLPQQLSRFSPSSCCTLLSACHIVKVRSCVQGASHHTDPESHSVPNPHAHQPVPPVLDLLAGESQLLWDSKLQLCAPQCETLQLGTACLPGRLPAWGLRALCA